MSSLAFFAWVGGALRRDVYNPEEHLQHARMVCVYYHKSKHFVGCVRYGCDDRR